MLNFGTGKFEQKRKIEVIKLLLVSGYTLDDMEKEQLFISNDLLDFMKRNREDFCDLKFSQRSDENDINQKQ